MYFVKDGDINSFIQELSDPEEHFPENFVSSEKALALCLCMMQDAAYGLEKLQKILKEKENEV